jgi:hypothetical protein
MLDILKDRSPLAPHRPEWVVVEGRDRLATFRTRKDAAKYAEVLEGRRAAEAAPQPPAGPSVAETLRECLMTVVDILEPTASGSAALIRVAANEALRLERVRDGIHAILDGLPPAERDSPAWRAVREALYPKIDETPVVGPSAPPIS